MHFCDHFLFLHLQKTGGNHVSKLLERHFELTRQGRHNGIPDGLMRKRVFFGIRNPWDWYVSLWAYGCQNEGALWAYLNASRFESAMRTIGQYGYQPRNWTLVAPQIFGLASKSKKTWRSFYRNTEDAGAFRDWLHYLHSEPGSRHTGEDFSSLPIKQCCGLLTTRYLQVGSKVTDWNAHRKSIKSRADAAHYRENFLAATHFIRTESLEADVAAALGSVGIKETAEGLLTKRTNSSKHRSSSYYYDAAAKALVAERDSVVIAAHKYTFPD